ncbi:hypothetical protein BpHYR1_033711 [Brachionus plicatilis]|uniref:Uncharacterized protein n=1 Tax=Brachionus plicatilis TaxID=10195 RepID=A0A3M7RN33_BRAPC|nr:hypothetical protein BpHYR1_033711 [Brachionus plicatilis]
MVELINWNLSTVISKIIQKIKIKHTEIIVKIISWGFNRVLVVLGLFFIYTPGPRGNMQGFMEFKKCLIKNNTSRHQNRVLYFKGKLLIIRQVTFFKQLSINMKLENDRTY